MEIKGEITILIDRDGADIEIHDDDASLTFVRIHLRTMPERMGK